MNKDINAFIAHRTEALATVYLTRRQDVTVTPFQRGHLDLFVTVTPDEDESPRGFLNLGVIAWGTDKALDSTAAADQFANAKWRNKSKRQRDETIYYFPVILMLFSMVNDEGYFAWVTEPSTRQGAGGPTLAHLERLTFSKLDRGVLDKIIAKVKAWYGSFASELLVAK